jgi:DNA helicase IV
LDVSAELAAEQVVLDRAVARLDAIRAEAEAVAAEVRTMGAGGTQQGRLERDIRVTNAARRLSRLNIGNQPLAIGRIDLDDGVAWRIGRLSVDDADREPLVVDWRAGAAQPFYRATQLDPCGVVRRRHYQYAKDSVFRGEHASRRLSGLQDELLGDGDGRGTALVLVGEGALLAALNRRRSGRMADIVATIQRQQDEVIRAPLGGVLVVQGGPGTGKTAVALHRAAYLLYTHPVPLETTGLLLVGPNPLFLRYVEAVLPSLGEHTVTLATPASLVAGVSVTRTDDAEAARVKGDRRMVEVVRRGRALLCRPLRADLTVADGPAELRLSVAASTEIVHTTRRRAGSHAARRRLVEKLVIDALVEAHWAAQRRLLAAGRLGEEAAEPDEERSARLRTRLRRHPDVVRALDRMWPPLQPADVVRGLWQSEAVLRRAARGILSDAEVQALVASAVASPESEQPESEQPESEWTEADVALIDEARALIGPTAPAPKRARTAADPEAEAQAELIDRVMSESSPECPDCSSELTWDPARRRWRCGNSGCQAVWRPEQVMSPEAQQLFESVLAHVIAGTGRGEEAGTEGPGADRTFGHVLVDEAQELSPMQWRMLARRCPSRSFTVTGDLDQASGSWAADSWAAALAPALEGSGVPVSVTELSVNYRTPGEVMELAASVLAAGGGQGRPPASVRRAGVAPALIPVGSEAEMAVAASAVAPRMLAALTGGRIGVIAPARMVGELRGVLNGESPGTGGAQLDLEQPVVVMDVVTAKGLEFDGVVVVDPGAVVAEQPRGWAALYVAVTRTTQALCFIGGQDLSVLAAVKRVGNPGDLAYEPDAEEVGWVRS